MKNDVKNLKKKSSQATAKLAENEKSKNVIEISKKEVSDNDLMKNLSDLNIDNLIKKSAKGRSIWKTDFKLCYAEDEKKARRKIRTAQMEYSKALLHSIITKQSNDIIKTCAERLHSFYKKGLNDFSIFSNISENESPNKFKIVHQAYAKMNLLIK